MKRILACVFLSIVLTTTALAGVVEMPGKTEPPPPPSTSTTSTSGALTQIILIIMDLTVKR